MRFTLKVNLSKVICLVLSFLTVQSGYSQVWSGDTLRLNPITFNDPSPNGWNAQYKTVVNFPDGEIQWSKILMIQTLKCDSASAGDTYPCGEWDYIWNTLIEVPAGDSVEVYTLGSFVTPYGKRLKLGSENSWKWSYDISEYAPLLRGERELTSGNNQELMNLEFLFIKGTPAREVLSVENLYPYADYRYEHLATDSLLKERQVVLSNEAEGFRLKAIISGHGHAGPRNCCEWDSKTHSYYLNQWETYRWNVWKDCGNNPIYPQGGTWPFDRAGWCPGTKVDEYEFELTPKVTPGDTILLDYGIEYFRDNGEKDGTFRMSHQLFSYGPPNFKNDAALLKILTPSAEDSYSRMNPDCGAPKIVIQNQGKNPLLSVIIKYGMKGSGKQKYMWQGHLDFLETKDISLPQLNFKKMRVAGEFEVELILPKAIKDENGENNKLSSSYTPPGVFPDVFKVVIETNNLGRASENELSISDASGLVWYFEDSFNDSSRYEIPVELARGCYSFKFSDDQEDGISQHWWNRNAEPDQVGISGNVLIESMQGDTLKMFQPDFGQELLLNFMVE